MNAPILFIISAAWLLVTCNAMFDVDYKNILVYGGIFLTNTGLALHALH
jgi:hypothetical protein